MKVVQLGGVQPYPHGVLGAEQLQFTHPFQTADNILDVGDQIVCQGVTVHRAVFRHEPDNHKKVSGGFDHLNTLPLHDLRQKRRGKLQLVLHLYLGDVRIGAGLEGQVDGHRTGRVAGGRHIDQVIYPVQLLFDDLGDGILHGLGRGTWIHCIYGYLGRRDGRVLGNRQGLDRQQAGQHDQDGDHHGEDRTIYEESGHEVSPLFICCCRFGSSRREFHPPCCRTARP